MLRVACYVHQIDKGYETTINLMAVSKVNERDLDEALQDIAKSRVPIFYVVDSFGSTYCENIQHLVRKYREALPNKVLGIHAHNNMQLAMSNTITAIIENCNMLDAIQHHIHPLQQVISWGYHIPHLITGALNEHPRSAMKWMASENKDDFVAFMKEMHDYELLE
jgi:4-hydroxy 2-oxovalerate aldolase